MFPHPRPVYRLALVVALVSVLAGQFLPTPAQIAFADGPTTTFVPFTTNNFGSTAPEPLSAQRGTQIYGSMIRRDGSPLQGVIVEVQGHPEFGSATTDANGRYSIEVNGGAPLILTFSKPGFLPAQRWVPTGWNDDPLVQPVALVELDPAVTTVNLTNPAGQVHKGTSQNDKDGARQSALAFMPGTTATLRRPDGSEQPISTINVRATEYTVGPNGQAAMPADLPPSSAYTYAFEFSADEAAGGQVRFSRPVINYVDNFLGVPVGITVPVGIRNPNTANWNPSDDGRVIEIIDVKDRNVPAEIDIDGDKIPESPERLLRELNIDENERRSISRNFNNNQSLWRVPVRQTGSFDHNWPRRCKEVGSNGQPTCKPPDLKKWGNDDPFQDPCAADGSIIGCQTQTLAEEVKISGTSFDLYYTTSRTPGFAGVPTLNLEIFTGTVPSDLKRIETNLYIAGRTITQTFQGSEIFAGQVFSYTWDGLDVDGRKRAGRQYYSVQVNYVYDAVYIDRASGTAFGFGTVGLNNFPLAPSRFDIPKSQFLYGYLGVTPAVVGSVGGWTPTIHHAYNPDTGELYLGDGRVRTSGANGAENLIDTVAGRNERADDNIGDGGPAKQAGFDSPYGVAVAADGTVYVSELDGQRVRRIGTDGIITTVAGNGQTTPSDNRSHEERIGEGLPATQATFNDPTGITIGPDGLLYIPDLNNHRVRRVNADGRIVTVAGGGKNAGVPNQGDGGKATDAIISAPSDVKFGSDGSMYILEFRGAVRRVSPDGTIQTFAGGSTSGTDPGDGGPALAARFTTPRAMAIDRDGSVYLSELGGNVIRRITPEGRVERVAGTGERGFSEDGQAAIASKINQPAGLAIGPDGHLYFSDSGNNLVRKLEGGKLVTYAGSTTSSVKGDGGPPRAARLSAPYGLAFLPDGTLYIVDGGRHNLRVVQIVQPAQLSAGDILVPSDDGSEAYVFDSKNRHVKTLNALTGSERWKFAYDSADRLISITDINGGVTRIERDGSGVPTGFVAPYGQRTTLGVTDGYITQITNNVNETHRFTYTANGLMTEHLDPRNNRSTYTYENLTGRLLTAVNPVGGETKLRRVETSAGYYVGITTPEGNIGGWQIQGEGGALVQYSSPPGLGRRIDTVVYDDGVTNIEDANTKVRNATAVGPDPIWGMRVPIEATNIYTTPGGIYSRADHVSSATLAQAGNPLSLQRRHEIVDIFSSTSSASRQRYDSGYLAATRTITERTPAGRVLTQTLDALGRVATYQRGGLAPIDFAYGSNGRPQTVTQGSGADSRVTQFSYDGNGYLAKVVQPNGGETSFTYDGIGRVTSATGPDGGTTRYSYDANGNVTAIQPPGREAFAFTHSALDQMSSYTAPGGAATQHTYDKEGRITSVARPDGQTATYTYPQAFPNGRASIISTPSGQFVYAYAYQTGLLEGIGAPGGVSQTIVYDGDVPIRENYLGPLPGVVTRTINGAGAILSRGVNGVPVNYEYDEDNLVEVIRAAGTTYNVTRDAKTGRVASTFLSGITTTIRANQFHEPTHYSAARSGNVYYSSDFTFDPLGRILTKSEKISNTTTLYAYGYDAAGRLITVQENGAPAAQYTYDANGNRLSSSRTGAAGVYNGQDQIQTYGGATYTYNAAGELQSRVKDATTTSYAFNALGQLTGVVTGTTNVNYVVDGYGRRVAKQVNGTTVQGFLYQNRYRPIAELDGSGNVISRFVYSNEGPTPDLFIKGGVTYRIIPDYLGSPRLVVNAATGAIVQRMNYDEFGNVILDTNPGFQPFGYAGGIYDRDSGLVHFGKREYDPETGRWISRDPKLFSGGSTNLYAYAANDPINFSDPTGSWVEVQIGGFVGVGGTIKVSVNAEGFAITPEAGVGVGAGIQINVDPNLDLPKERLELNAEAKVGAGIIGQVGAAAKLDDCGDSEIKSKFCLTVFCGEASVEGGFNKPPEWKKKGFAEGNIDFGGGETMVGAEAKITVSRPFTFRW